MRELTDMARETFEKITTAHYAHLVEALKHLRASQMVTPKSYKQAMRGDFRKYWEQAVATEVQNLLSHKVFEWVAKPVDKRLIDSNWAWKIKTNDQGQISKFKARLVARGFRQVYGIDCFRLRGHYGPRGEAYFLQDVAGGVRPTRHGCEFRGYQISLPQG